MKLHEKREHYKTVFAKIGKNSKLLWNVLNTMVKKTNDKSGIPELLYNGRVYSEQSEICNIFNEHFSTAGKRVQQTIETTPGGDPCGSVISPGKKLKFKHISEGEICRIISKLPAKTSYGFDDISNHFLKQIGSVIKTPLCDIFNKSLQTGVFPDLMKLAKVIPLHKGGSMTHQTITDQLVFCR